MARVLPLNIEPGEMARVGETVVGMPTSSATTSDNGIEHSEHNIKDDEYARLVPPAQHAAADINTQVLPEQPESRHFIWWMKVLLGCFLLIIVSYIFVKFGVPFAFEKVLLPIMQWEASAFGRPVLALVLVASLALLPLILVPSGPSMWLAGMIFGYGWGFVIIMYGNYKMPPVEIAYNIISSIVAVLLTVSFTIYAKRALDDIRSTDEQANGLAALKNDHESLDVV
uniref:Uncharacterized protein n=1 Tax=Avena sativa TaxID=4498 RepID=A0ACD5WHU2_AVESA